jgi:hypothetical protein
MFGNYAAHAGILAGKNFASVNIEWDFGNAVVLGFDPFPSNINDRPRINTWRSDGTNLNYMSGGRDVFYPPFSPTGQIFQPWGDRRTGQTEFNISLIGNTFAGVDVFVPSTGIYIDFTPPLGPNSWTKINSIPGEDQYQYLLKNGKNPNLKISFETPVLFWDFTEDPFAKTLTNFKVIYNNGNVRADWGDGNVSGIISNTNYNHTWGSYQPDNFYYIEGSGDVFNFNELGINQRMSYSSYNGYWVKYFGAVTNPTNQNYFYRFWNGTGGIGINNWWGGIYGLEGTAILSGGYNSFAIVEYATGNFKITFNPNTLQFTVGGSPNMASNTNGYIVSSYGQIGTTLLDYNYYYDGWRYEKTLTFNQNTGIEFRFLFSGQDSAFFYGDSNLDGSLESAGAPIFLNAVSGRTYKFAFRIFEFDYIPYEVIDLG